LVFWLRSILGTRDEDEAQRPSLNLEIDDTGKVIGFDTGNGKGADKAVALIDELAENPKGNMLIADKTTQETLIEIAEADHDFDIYVFLQASQDAFVYIVESFAEGDRETLEDLLSDEVFKAFDGAISAREKAEETMVALPYVFGQKKHLLQKIAMAKFCMGTQKKQLKCAMFGHSLAL